MRWYQALVIPIAFAAAACGRFGFREGGDGPTDGVHVDAGPNDPDAGLGLFATPTAIIELNDPTQQDDDPTLTDDLLELYFDSSRDGGATSGMGDIWVAKRTAVADPFGAPTLVAELASTADDTTPDITGDGLRIYWGSDRSSPGNRELYVSSRADRSSPWSVPAIIPELTSPGDDSGAIEIDNGRGLIFCSSRAGTQDLYLTTRSAIGQPWSTPVAIPGLSDPTIGESQHWANADGTIVYFSSSDIAGGELTDIWVATRPDAASAFGPPQRVTEVDSAVDDVDPWLSPDLRTMVFMSYRTGNGDLYVTTR